MGLAILGIGNSVPRHCISQREAADLAIQVCCDTPEHKTLVPVLYRQAGIKNRHLAVPPGLAIELSGSSVNNNAGQNGDHGHARRGPGTEYRMALYREHALDLALRASQHAFDHSRLAPSNISHLVTVSCTGFSAPGVDLGLIKQLGLSPSVQRINVGFMGCHGAINGLRVAQAFCDADSHSSVLLCAVELCSIHYHFGWNPKSVVANALFADGAAAVVGSHGGSIDKPWCVVATGSHLFPNSEKAMTWQIGDYGFEMTLAARVPDLISNHLRLWLANWLAEHGVTLDQVGSWAIHPGGPRILLAVERALELDKDATLISREVLAEFGNMSSPTVLFVLDRLRHSDAARPCVVLGFGPGLMVEVALVL